MTIRIIDYGSGNLHSVQKAFDLMAQKHGLRAELTSDAASLTDASHIVLPGVGAFGDCVAGLRALPNMWEALNDAVITRKKPFFGICVGMQMMMQRGLEHGAHEGLGWIDGEVVPLNPKADSLTPLKIPHMGWNELCVTQAHPVLRDLGEDPHVYFVHSYHAQCADASHVLATTDYGSAITACIGAGNMIGSQFHPEKSGETGLQMIEYFVQWNGQLS